MSIEYTFGKPNLSFDGRYLAIKHCNKILKFTNIRNFKIEGSALSFCGDYIPEKNEIISFKLKDNTTLLGRFIEFTHDRTSVKVDFSFDTIVQFPCVEPICYSDVEVITFTRTSDNVQYENVWKSIGYIHDEETGIIRKDIWTPKEGDTYWFINDDAMIVSAIFKNQFKLCQDHLKVCNCFKTSQEAETIRDQFLKLLSER